MSISFCVCMLELSCTFPEHNVRYIAVNDVVDTDEQESADFTPFRNIINERYAKDTSKKVKSAKRARVGRYTLAHDKMACVHRISEYAPDAVIAPLITPCIVLTVKMPFISVMWGLRLRNDAFQSAQKPEGRTD